MILYKSTCKPCAAKRARGWAHDNPDRNRDNSLNWALKNTYGISREEYDRMMTEQDGRCAICGLDEPNSHGRTGTKFRLSVDHCHDTGRVRGLLCQKCNRAVGLLGDDIDLLKKAIDYLERK